MPLKCAETVPPNWSPTTQASSGETTVTATPNWSPTLGGGENVHAVPSKCSRSKAETPSPLEKVPTAQRSSGLVPATPASSSKAPAPVSGSGLGTTVQVVPSQCSISVRPPVWPTAHASVVLRSSTPLRLEVPSRPSGSVTVVRARPSQCSARRVDEVEVSEPSIGVGVEARPTAQASVPEAADTALRPESVPEGRPVGDGRARHGLDGGPAGSELAGLAGAGPELSASPSARGRVPRAADRPAAPGGCHGALSEWRVTGNPMVPPASLGLLSGTTVRRNEPATQS